MQSPPFKSSQQKIPLWLALFLWLSSITPVFAYKPSSPEVQALVKRGVTYIEREITGQKPGESSMELGAYCICGLACYSHTGNPDHPVVTRAVNEIRTHLKKGIPHEGHTNYSLGIALIFLGSLDPVAYEAETKALLDLVYKRQMSGGGWSYPGHETGDTSQTQFACLGMWMAHRQGIEVPIPVVDKVTNWLLRTQAPDGGFGYQGKDPGTFTRVAQQRTSPSMGVAGTGSLYVCGELLGFVQPSENDSNVPSLKKVRKKKAVVVSTTVDASKWRTAVADGDGWVGRNAGVENPIEGVIAQQYYYMYSVERYWAFRDLATGTPSAEPAWYNSGVDYLRKNVTQAGGWQSDNDMPVDTAFAVLFLLRSSQKTIQRIVEMAGRLTGGKTLPTDVTAVRQDATGKIVSSDAERNLEEIMRELEDPNSPTGSALEDLAKQLTKALGRGAATQQADRVRRMAISGPFQGRLAAVKALGQVRDLDNAPTLIFALTDPDTRVARAALDGLRFLSRKFDGPSIADDATDQQKASVAASWKKWYLTIRPDGALIE